MQHTSALKLPSGLFPVGLFSLLAWCGMAHAVPRPQMPERFDKVTVETLISTIDQGQNVTILKFGYFLPRNSAAYPMADGLTALRQAAQAEPKGSKKWVALESTLGFGSFYSLAGQGAQGYQAYGDLFSAAAQIQDETIQEEVQRAIQDMVVVLPSDFGASAVKDGGQPAMLAALKARLAYLAKHPTDLRIMPWSRAVGLAYVDAEALGIVDEVLKDPNSKNSYALLWTSADVVRDKHPEKAIELLQSAKTLLDTAHLNKKQLSQYYTTLIALLNDENKAEEAIQVQKEAVEKTQEGLGNLVVLLSASGKQPEAEALFASLSASYPDAEIVDTANRISRLPAVKPNATTEPNLASNPASNADPNAAPVATHVTDSPAIRLLRLYLSNGRPHEVAWELSARLTLARELIRFKQPDEAKKVLSELPPIPVKTGAITTWLQRIARTLKDLEKTNP